VIGINNFAARRKLGGFSLFAERGFDCSWISKVRPTIELSYSRHATSWPENRDTPAT